MVPLKFGWQQGTITVDVSVEIGEVEYRAFMHFPRCLQLVSNFLLGKDFQFGHVVLRTLLHRDRESDGSIGEILSVRYCHELNEATRDIQITKSNEATGDLIPGEQITLLDGKLTSEFGGAEGAVPYKPDFRQPEAWPLQNVGFQRCRLRYGNGISRL